MKKVLFTAMILTLLLMMCMPIVFAAKEIFTVQYETVEVTFTESDGNFRWSYIDGVSTKYIIKVFDNSGKLFEDNCGSAFYPMRSKLRSLNVPNGKLRMYVEAIGLNKLSKTYYFDYEGGNASIKINMSDDGVMTWNKPSGAAKYYVKYYQGGASGSQLPETESFDLKGRLDNYGYGAGTLDVLVEALDKDGKDMGIYGTCKYNYLKTLANPDHVRWSDTNARWAKVTWATDYVVKLYNEKDEVVATKNVSNDDIYRFSKDELKAGYYFGVIATAKGYKDTDEIFSLKYAVEYPTLADPTNLRWEDDYLAKWDAVEHATSYNITLCNLAGGVMKKDKTSKAEYDFSTTAVYKGHYFIVNATAEGYNESKSISSPKYDDEVVEQPKEEVKYLVKFSSNGGSEVESQEVVENQKATKPKDPTKEGYTFEGWYTTKKLTTLFDFDKGVVADYVLYAKWTEVKQEEKTSGDKTDTEPKEKPWAKASDWAIEELDKANEAELIPNMFDNENLTKNITRKEFAHVAVKLYEKLTGNKAVAVANNPFKDTNDTEVLKAYNIGITQGTGADTFEPDTLITREQMATMMTRALTKAGIDTTVDLNKATKFADDESIGVWYVESVYFMSNVEIIKGVGDNKFNPKGGASREASLLISVRSTEKFAKK